LSVLLIRAWIGGIAELNGRGNELIKGRTVPAATPRLNEIVQVDLAAQPAAPRCD
jgi:hypothetical protein